MNTSRPSVSLPRPIASGAVAVAVVALVAAAALPAAGDPPRTSYPGEPGTVVERTGDGLVPSVRYHGADRFDTARLIAEDGHDRAVDVVLARSDLFPDALAGNYLAGHLGAPLLLTRSSGLTEDTAESLERLDAARVILLGETAAIDGTVADQLEERGYAVERVGGADRFATARAVATHEETTPGSREGEGITAVVARSDDFPDALVAGSVSYAASFPLLLTAGDSLHEDARAALDELDVDHVIIPGGPAAVPTSILEELEDDGISVERVDGADRVETSVEFAYFTRDALGFSLDHINMARGDAFPDALTIGPHAGSEGNPIVLTATPSRLGGDGSVDELLGDVCEVSSLHVAGGTAAIDSDLEQQMREQATSTGAICDITFSAADAEAVNPPGTEHAVTGLVVDNAGAGAVEDADVRFQVFRSDLEVGPGELALELEFEEVVTSEGGQAELAYTGPDEEAVDYIVACTEPITGDDPGTCIDDVGGLSVLVVVDGEPQNVRGDVAIDVAVKEWDATADDDPDDGASLFDAQFCDGTVGDLLEPCEPYETFGDAEGDFLQLTFDDALSPLVEPELDASITISHGDGEETFTSADGVVFLTAAEVDELDIGELTDLLGDIDPINDDQLLVVVENVIVDAPSVDDATSEQVLALSGVQDLEGRDVVVPPTNIEPFTAALLD